MRVHNCCKLSADWTDGAGQVSSTRLVLTSDGTWIRAMGWTAQHGWFDLHAIVDCCTPEIVATNIELRCRTDEALACVDAAIAQRVRRAGLLGSIGTVGDVLDNAVAESFFASLACELLDRHSWPTRTGLAQAISHRIEAFYN